MFPTSSAVDQPIHYVNFGAYLWQWIRQPQHTAPSTFLFGHSSSLSTNFTSPLHLAKSPLLRHVQQQPLIALPPLLPNLLLPPLHQRLHWDHFVRLHHCLPHFCAHPITTNASSPHPSHIAPQPLHQQFHCSATLLLVSASSVPLIHYRSHNSDANNPFNDHSPSPSNITFGIVSSMQLQIITFFLVCSFLMACFLTIRASAPIAHPLVLLSHTNHSPWQER